MNWSSLINGQNIVFGLLIGGTFLGFLLKFNKNNSKLKIGSQILVGLGVLGTFVGIFLALMNFNAQDIQGSITTLLDGLKTAFVTSIVGMFLSMGLNVKVFINNLHSTDTGTNSLETLINKLDELIKWNKYVYKAIIGDGDTSLSTQLQKLRTENRDGFYGMRKSFDEFAIKMAENNYNALIVALKEVINDFNALLSDLVAENFKQLNQGIEKLLQWQDNYAMQIDDQTRQLETATDTMESIFAKFSEMGDRFEIFVKNSMNFDTTAQNTEKLLIYTNSVLVELSGKMRDFAEIGVNASTAFNEIDKKIKLMVDTMANSIQMQTNKANDISNSFKLNTENLLRTGQETINGYLKSNNDAINKSIQEYDKQLQNQLENILTSFGNQLVSISNHFVKDYSQVTTNLKLMISSMESSSNGTNRN